MDLKLLRTCFIKGTTTGVLLLDNKFFCYTLEDPVRQLGKKVPGMTAIPVGSYEVIVTRSARFKRDMPLIKNVIGFTGIRMHGGNDVGDTDGCPLVAFTRVSDCKIYGTAEKDLTRKLKAAGPVNYLTVMNIF